jgi:hypothetical protein
VTLDDPYGASAVAPTGPLFSRIMQSAVIQYSIEN